MSQVDFELSEEQKDIRSLLGKVLADQGPVVAPGGVSTDIDSTLWQLLSRELGVTGILVPPEHGGLGLGFVELTLVLEELGAVLAATPFLGTTLAAGLLLASGDPAAQGKYLPRIAAGDLCAVVVTGSVAGEPGQGTPGVRARLDGDTWLLSGMTELVADATPASVVFVFAQEPAGLGLYVVSVASDGVRSVLDSSYDPTRVLSRFELDDAPAERLAVPDSLETVRAQFLDLAALALAAEQLGGARRCLDLAVTHAKNRVQFGRPVGAFQAIKHKCADTLIGIEAARSAVTYAAWAADHDKRGITRAAAIAKAVASDAFLLAAQTNVQVHAGIGFTWEHPAHLYLKRARLSQRLFGTPRQHRDIVAGLGIPSNKPVKVVEPSDVQ